MKNKRNVLLIVIALLIFTLVACTDGNENEKTFTGTIEEINGDMAIVSIEKGEILKSGSKAGVNLSVASDTEFQIGDKVRVGYDGDIREIFPLGINTISVELVK